MRRQQHFTRKEYGMWWHQMHPVILFQMDLGRERWGSPWYISPHPKALGRHLGENDESRHNIDRWGSVMANDFFVPSVNNHRDVEAMVSLAKKLGVGGIGFYPDWSYDEVGADCGFHWDCRDDRDFGRPATWGRINGEIVSLREAIDFYRDKKRDQLY